MSPAYFVNQLAAVHLANVFNPYADSCPAYDKVNAAEIRRNNLRCYFEAVLALGVDTIWMGRDLGYLGGRRTGMALTDEHHLPHAHLVYERFFPVRATHGAAIKERTATEIWSLLRELRKPPLLWNVFQFHPHEPNKPFSNRKFAVRERKMADDINAELINWIGIERIVGVGSDAVTYAQQFDVKVVPVRHPSYGGIVAFRHGIRTEYGLKSVRTGASPTQHPLFT